MAYPEGKEWAEKRREALLCLIYYTGGENYQLSPIETYGRLANFFNLSEAERNKVISVYDDRNHWENLIQNSRQQLIKLGYLDGSVREKWQLTHKGIDQATRLEKEYNVLKYINSKKLKLEDRVISTITEQTEVEQETQKYGTGGESERHKRLKQYIARNPFIINMSLDCEVIIERSFPTGDRVDIFMKDGHINLAVIEIELEGEENLIIGAKQLIKYRTLELVENNFPLDSQLCKAILVAYKINSQKLESFCKSYNIEFYQVEPI